jgi:parallel beta-helix repeat protein
MRKMKPLMHVLLFLAVLAIPLIPTLKVKAETYVLNVSEGDDIYKEMRNVMSVAATTATDDNPATVVIPAGNYTLSTVLRLYSNVTVDATGATITYSNPSGERHNMLLSGFITYNESDACSGYNGYKNIGIKGGTWVSTSTNNASTLKIMHATNVVIDGATFVGGGSAHQVELAAIDGLTVTNCVFRDFAGKKGDKSEALQLDMPCAQSVYGDTFEDGTPMKNVTISGCTFSNVPRGLGTHTLLLGAWHENIVIKDNTFENVAEECISTVNYYNCEIYNNTMKDCGGGILVQTYKKNAESIYSTTEDPASFTAKTVDDMKISIHDNTMTICYSASCDEIQGIDLIGGIVTSTKLKGGDGKEVPKGDYRVKGVTIENNTITTAGFGIHMQGACNVTVKNNTITGSGYSSKDADKDKYDGIFIQTDSEKVSVTGNSITGASRCGIFVMENASASNIKNNTIKNCPKYGIGFYDGAGLTGTMSGNKISGKVETGISVSTNCTLNMVTKNTVTKPASNAMNIYLKSKVTEISGNTFTGPGKNGIIVSTNSTVGTIQDNTITSPKEDGIQLYSKSKVSTISGNAISKSTKDGIFLSTGCTAGTIKGNTISNAKREGIQIYSKCKVTSGITGNKIKGSANNAVKITEKCTISKIESNTITTAGSNGILICNNSTVSKDVKNNKIKKVKGSTVSVTSGAKISGKNKN